ncbi:hypothetical protein D3C73_1221320 [compost metagenome]
MMVGHFIQPGGKRFKFPITLKLPIHFHKNILNRILSFFTTLQNVITIRIYLPFKGPDYRCKSLTVSCTHLIYGFINQRWTRLGPGVSPFQRITSSLTAYTYITLFSSRIVTSGKKGKYPLNKKRQSPLSFQRAVAFFIFTTKQT